MIPLSWLTSRKTGSTATCGAACCDNDAVRDIADRLGRGFTDIEVRRCPAGSAASCTRSAPAPACALMSRWRPGRDRQAVRHAGPAGAHSGGDRAARDRNRVVGGGIAGLAAAVALAERGVP